MKITISDKIDQNRILFANETYVAVEEDPFHPHCCDCCFRSRTDYCYFINSVLNPCCPKDRIDKRSVIWKKQLVQK